MKSLPAALMLALSAAIVALHAHDVGWIPATRGPASPSALAVVWVVRRTPGLDGLALVGVIWTSTWIWQVPAHRRLALLNPPR